MKVTKLCALMAKQFTNPFHATESVQRRVCPPYLEERVNCPVDTAVTLAVTRIT